MIVMVVYWSVLWRKDLDKCKLETNEWYALYFYWHKILIHSAPAVGVIVNTILTRGIVIPGHSLYMIIVGVIYLPINYFGTMIRNEPLYHFMPWHDYKTLVIGLTIFCFAALIQQCFCWLTITFKQTQSEYIELKDDPKS